MSDIKSKDSFDKTYLRANHKMNGNKGTLRTYTVNWCLSSRNLCVEFTVTVTFCKDSVGVPLVEEEQG